jgi:hypothetical protein
LAGNNVTENALTCLLLVLLLADSFAVDQVDRMVGCDQHSSANIEDRYSGINTVFVCVTP